MSRQQCKRFVNCALLAEDKERIHLIIQPPIQTQTYTYEMNIVIVHEEFGVYYPSVFEFTANCINEIVGGGLLFISLDFRLFSLLQARKISAIVHSNISLYARLTFITIFNRLSYLTIVWIRDNERLFIIFA